MYKFIRMNWSEKTQEQERFRLMSMIVKVWNGPLIIFLSAAEIYLAINMWFSSCTQFINSLFMQLYAIIIFNIYTAHLDTSHAALTVDYYCS